MLLMREMLLALGLLLSSESQLRLGSLPLGPGEICLVIWIFLIPRREVVWLARPLLTTVFSKTAFSKLLVFWLLFALAQIVGTLTGFAIGDEHDSDLFLHDALAYPLLATVSCLSVVGPEAGPRLRRVAWDLAALGSATLAPQLAAAWGLFQIHGLDPWYWDRFRGWSQSPNQLGLLCAVLGFVCLHLAETAARLNGRIAAAACAILPIYVGRLSGSDAFTMALLAAGPIFVAFKLWTWMLSEKGVTLGFTFAWLGLLVMALTIPVVLMFPGEAQRFALGFAKNGGVEVNQEAELRLDSWHDAWRRGLESRMLGLGPGPHLKIPASLLAARLVETDDPLYNEHPKLSSAPNFEAHNTLLDLFTQGGLLAVLSLVWLTATALFNSYKARLAGLFALLCGLSIYGMTGLYVRHPIFWFAIAFCLAAEGRAGKTSVVRNRGQKEAVASPIY
jgi:O-antigen ligase